MSNNPDTDINEAEEAYLSFGGWAKAMPNPPGLHDRRRYTVDVECTAAGIGTSEKGERHTRKLSILRVVEVVGAKVPDADTDEAQGALFDEGGSPKPDSEIGWKDASSAEDGQTGEWPEAEAAEAEPGAEEPAEAEAAAEDDNVVAFSAKGGK